MPTIDVQDCPLHYEESGDPAAPVLVLLHGAGGNSAIWPEGLLRLPGARVLSVDLPGHGRSAPPGCGSVAPYAATVAALLDRLAIRDAAWCGHSLGGVIAVQAALAGYPSMAKAIAIGASARMRVGEQLLDDLQYDYGKAIDFIMEYGFASGAPPEVREPCRQGLAACDPAMTYGDFLACNQFDVRDRLVEVGRPVLVISGTEDRLVPPRFAEALAMGLPDGHFLSLEAAGHFAMLEQPEAVITAVRDFLFNGPNPS